MQPRNNARPERRRDAAPSTPWWPGGSGRKLAPGRRPVIGRSAAAYRGKRESPGNSRRFIDRGPPARLRPRRSRVAPGPRQPARPLFRGNCRGTRTTALPRRFAFLKPRGGGWLPKKVLRGTVAAKIGLLSNEAVKVGHNRKVMMIGGKILFKCGSDDFAETGSGKYCF